LSPDQKRWSIQPSNSGGIYAKKGISTQSYNSSHHCLIKDSLNNVPGTPSGTPQSRASSAQDSQTPQSQDSARFQTPPSPQNQSNQQVQLRPRRSATSFANYQDLENFFRTLPRAENTPSSRPRNQSLESQRSPTPLMSNNSFASSDMSPVRLTPRNLIASFNFEADVARFRSDDLLETELFNFTGASEGGNILTSLPRFVTNNMSTEEQQTRQDLVSTISQTPEGSDRDDLINQLHTADELFYMRAGFERPTKHAPKA
jgi:hypothetical protein